MGTLESLFSSQFWRPNVQDWVALPIQPLVRAPLILPQPGGRVKRAHVHGVALLYKNFLS